MKAIKLSLIALAIAVSLTACSDNNNENPSSNNAVSIAQTSELSTTKITMASIDSDKEEESESFKQVLAHIPADTAYLMANKKAFPRDMLELQLKRGQQVLAMLESFMDDATERSTGADQSAQPRSKEQDKFITFTKALLADIRGNMSVEKLVNTGIKANVRSALYAVDLMPVIRYEIVSKKAVMETIKRAEKASGYQVEWESCGKYQCIEKNSEDGRSAIAIALLEDHVVASFFPVDKKPIIMAHLTGESKPEKNYSESKWDAFLAENTYQGYGDGFINLKKVYDVVEGLILVQAKKEAIAKGEPFDNKSAEACSAVVKRHFDNIPEAVFGITALQKQSLSYEVLLKTNPVISAALQAIPNPLTSMQKAENPVFDLGLNINIGKLREGLTQYTNFLVKTAGEAGCDVVKPVAIRKAMGGLAMATMMGANQFKAFYVSLNDIKMNTEGKPEDIDLFASVLADNPGSLLQMLAMTNPVFAILDLPKDGTAMKLPEGLVPPNPAGINPDLYLSKKDKLLTLMVGNDNPPVKPFTTNRPAFLWSTIDSKRYHNLIADVLEKTSKGQGKSKQAEKNKKADKTIEMMSKLRQFSSVVYTEIGADNRGISINYSVEYQ